jgi:muconate cycloisomerase
MSDTIKSVEAIPCRIPFRYGFVIGRGQVGVAGFGGSHVFVRIESEGGLVGWGEVRALPAWSYETLESITSAVRGYLAPLVVGRSAFDLNAIQQGMNDRLTPAISNGQPFAKAAVDIAIHDLQGRITGLPIHALLGGKVRSEVPLTYALSIAYPDTMAEQAAGYAECGCFKIKVAGEPDLDAQRVRAISEARPKATLWLDANQAYSPAKLVRFLKQIESVPRVFCLEQPVRSVDWMGMRIARERSPYPIAIDEGCFSSFDVARVAEMRAAEMVVLKVCKSGGLRECGKSAAVADAHGFGILGSGLTEAGVGFTASIHFFAAVDTLLPPELNGVQFLEPAWYESLTIDGAMVTVPDGPGLGIAVDEELIRRHAIEV